MIWPLYALAFVGTSLWALGAPAMRAMMPGLVRPSSSPPRRRCNRSTATLARSSGPAIGGVLIATAGYGATYMIDVASFAFSVVLISLIAPARPKGDVGKPSFDSFKAGFRFLGKQPVILGTFVLDTNAMIFGMPTALFPAVGVQRFKAGAGVVGLLYAALAVGALLASVCPAGSSTFVGRASPSPPRSSSGAGRSSASGSRPRSGSGWRCSRSPVRPTRSAPRSAR